MTPVLSFLVATACLQDHRPRYPEPCWDEDGPSETSMVLDGEVEAHRFLDIPQHGQKSEPFDPAQMVVEWGVPTILSPAYVQITGRLTVSDAEGRGVRPMDWFQGIGLLIVRDPGTECDWSLGFCREDTFDSLVIPRADGTFTACVDPLELHRRPGETDWFSVGIVLYETLEDTVYCPTEVYRYGIGTVSFGTETSTEHVETIYLPQSRTKLEIVGPSVLSATMQTINAAPSIDARYFDPLALVRAVNHLQALGKHGAIAALREFADLSWRGLPGWGNSSLPRIAENIDTCDRKSVALILRLLFELPGRSSHPYLKGVPNPRLPVEKEWLGQFPLGVHRGIPFLLVYGLGGTSTGEQEIDELIDLYEAEGVLRNGPMIPDDNPFRAARELAAVPGISRGGFEDRALMTQAVRMLSGVEGLELPTRPWGLAHWTTLEDRVEEFGIRWDPASGRYVKR